ncbi:DUF262 domain-containing protein [Arthrobacter sp. MYb222]|uniref:GmrSD restriction endonuclease domain-containing protein n=1 Tax=Arthrobacter sp. MYb222 TaxID=1848599 RepID=UPI0015E367F4|nr:DUF262 domain-containing protein [Arthrobacter sp. MYb222]
MKTNRESFALSWFNRKRRVIHLEPDYQREGGVWSKDKQQLFIDSVVNGYDIPKIYMHALDPNEHGGYEFAVVDGKQRISTLLGFLDGLVEFAPDFNYSGVECEIPPTAGLRYSDLPESTREVIKENSLDVVIIQTPEEDDIEELFSRLNNGEKLNAAETRNALGGKMAALVRDLARDPFFTEKLKFPNKRFSHYEVSCKLLYLEHNLQKSGGLNYVDVKKKFLDSFVVDYREIAQEDANKLISAVRGHLNAISPFFEKSDIELSKQSYPQLMYLFGRLILDKYGSRELPAKVRSFLKDFRLQRTANLNRDEDLRDAELSEYGRLMQQGTNDAGSMKMRVDILIKRFLQANPDIQLKDPRRAFTTEERWVLWHRAEKKCESCRRDLDTLDDLDGDHIIWHTEGGPTSLENARALCVSCNRSRLASSTNIQEDEN